MMWLDDHHGFTPGHCAAHAGHACALEALATAKANIASGKTERGDSPLHLASLGGHVEAVAVLLRAKADAAVRNGEDWTPLHLAVLQGARDENRQVVELLLQATGRLEAPREAPRAEKWTVLGLCAHHGHTELLGLLTASLGVEGTNNQGDTALHLAALAGHADVVRALSRAGASINAANRLGQTPAHMALHGASSQEDGLELGREVLRMLSGLGAQLALPDKAGDTPLHLAVALPGFAEAERLGVVEWFVAKGLGAKSHSNARGFTALALAKEGGPNLGAVSLLLEGAEAKPNAARGMVVCMKRKRGSAGLSSVVLEEREDPACSLKRLHVEVEAAEGEDHASAGGGGRKRKLFRLVKEVDAAQGEDAPAPRSLEGVALAPPGKGGLDPDAANQGGRAPVSAKRARRFEQVGKRRRFAEGEAVVLNEHGSTAAAASTRHSPSKVHLEMLAEMGYASELPEGYMPGGGGPEQEQDEVWGIYVEDETALEEELDAPEAIAEVSSVEVAVYDYGDPDAEEEDLWGDDGYDSNQEQYGYGEAPEEEEDEERDGMYIPRMDNPC